MKAERLIILYIYNIYGNLATYIAIIIHYNRILSIIIDRDHPLAYGSKRSIPIEGTRTRHHQIQYRVRSLIVIVGLVRKKIIIVTKIIKKVTHYRNKSMVPKIK